MAPTQEPPAAVCELLGTWGSFGWWIQAFLGFLCLASLVGKRFTDKIRRPWKVWFFDTSKQGVQALSIHLINIGLSMAFGELLDDSNADPCNWYSINLVLDCTIGLALMFILLRLLQCTYRLKCVNRPELARSGDYGESVDVRIFARQLLDWQALVFVQKPVLAAFVVCFRHELSSVADVLLGWLDPYPRVKLVVIMLIVPLALNIFALWTADSFLQADRQKPLGSEEVQAREPLSDGVIVGQKSPSSPKAPNIVELFDESDKLVSFQEWKQMPKLSEECSRSPEKK